MPSAPQATTSLGSVPGLGCVHILVGSCCMAMSSPSLEVCNRAGHPCGEGTVREFKHQLGSG